MRILFCKGEPNNSGGTLKFIRERCINRLSWEGNCLNDDHCEFEFPSICQTGTFAETTHFQLPTTTVVIDILPAITQVTKVINTVPRTSTTIIFTTTTIIATTTKNVLTMSVSASICPEGWTSNNNNCYFSNSLYLNNADASAWCDSNGATLMNIHNQDDLNFAISLNGGYFWVFFGKLIADQDLQGPPY